MTFRGTQHHTTQIALSFALALAAVLASNTANACMPPPIHETYSSDFGFAPPGLYAAKTQKDWEALWALSGLQGEVPSFTEGEQMAVGIFLGPRNTSGYHIEISGLIWTDEDGVAQLDYHIHEPQDVAAQILTTPFAIAILNRTAESLVDETGKIIPKPPELLKTPGDS